MARDTNDDPHAVRRETVWQIFVVISLVIACERRRRRNMFPLRVAFVLGETTPSSA